VGSKPAMNTHEARYHFPEPEPIPEVSRLGERYYVPDVEIDLPDEPSLDDTAHYFLLVLVRAATVI
jgi:hypothetical protein